MNFLQEAAVNQQQEIKALKQTLQDISVEVDNGVLQSQKSQQQGFNS